MFCTCPNPSRTGDEAKDGFGFNDDGMLVHAGCGNPTEAYWNVMNA